MRAMEVQHLSAQGWTLIGEPEGKEAPDAEGKAWRWPNSYKSDVIVDFAEAFNENPHWRRQHPDWKPQPPYPVNMVEHYPVVRWSDENRTEKLAEYYELVVQQDEIHRFMMNRYLEEDAYMTKPKDTDGPQALSDEDYALLPKRVYAFVIKERSFNLLDIDNLQPLEAQSDAFDSLLLDDINKKLIKSTVHAHFRRKEVEKQGIELLTQDLIRAKGRGLVMLLHGAPGVGKTATIEAIARMTNRPLITLGNFDRWSSGSMLDWVFRLANKWNCILSIDEVDVFLPRRTGHDNFQNGIVTSEPALFLPPPPPLLVLTMRMDGD